MTLIGPLAEELKILAGDLNAFQSLFCEIVASGRAAALNHGQVLDEMHQRAAAIGDALERLSQDPDVSAQDVLSCITLGRLVRRLAGEEGDDVIEDAGELDLF